MPQVHKALIHELLEDWLTEFAGLTLLSKVKTSRAKALSTIIISDEKLNHILRWRTNGLLDFYTLGLINPNEFQDYIQRFQQYVQTDSPNFTLLADVLKNIQAELSENLVLSNQMALDNYIRLADAARQAKTNAGYLHKLIKKGELDAFPEQRGMLNYWFVNTLCPRFQKLLTRLNPNYSKGLKNET